MNQKVPTVSAVHLLLRYLEQEGVKYIFGIPGGPLMPLYEALFERGTIKPILTKHEEGAAFMADGYARVSNTIGVCCATTGPGATNALTGIACAYMDSIPILLITAQVATTAFGKGAAQESTEHEVDIVQLYRLATKQSNLLISPENMAENIRSLLRKALTGRHGPVHLSLPANLVKRPIPLELQPPDSYRSVSLQFDRRSVQQAARLLLEAERPALLLGHGVNVARANEEALCLVERWQIPFVTTPKGKGAIADDHPLSFGSFGFAGSPRAEALLLSSNIDVLLSIGTSLGEFATSGWEPRLKPHKTLIHVDIDPAKLGRNYPSLGIMANAKSFLIELTYQMEREQKKGFYKKRGMQNILRIKEEIPWCLKPETLESNHVPLKPQRVISEMRRILPPETMLFVDIGGTTSWAVHYFQVQRPRTFFLNFGFASMGHAFPAAIGGKLAAPNKPVVALVGDAAFAMNGMELHTAAEYHIPIICVVLNNKGHGMVYHGENLLFGGKFHSGLFQRPLNITQIAEGLGVDAVRVEKPGEMEKALQWALSAEKPTLIEVLIDPEEEPPIGSRVKTVTSFYQDKEVSLSS